ncbi:hypothetical protein QR680_004232 [Steinernema hermaphroditum]|uniref:Uncharacterized protein n=1 Tax=Steinernema hermaphroditum TaxID=289476 RepID=A0AA39HN26_9BILA|nr:hypothetical protein QR680_004232 [Steinernema hermaphroditum]
MGTVPYAFCDDVLEQLRLLEQEFETFPEPWRSAMEKHLKCRQTFCIKISEDEDGWGYAFSGSGDDFQTWSVEGGEHRLNSPVSLEKVAKMDRRYVICHMAWFGGEFGGFREQKTPCSKEDIAKKLVPELNRLTRSWSHLNFLRELSAETAMQCYKMFQKQHYGFPSLGLPYAGPEFLAEFIENNYSFRRVQLLGTWPNNKRVEDILVELQRSNRDKVVHLMDDGRNLKVTMRMFKAAFDLWLNTRNGRVLSLWGIPDFTDEHVLSIPFPQNVTRRNEVTPDEWDDGYGMVRLITWTKEDGSFLEYYNNCRYETINLHNSVFLRE